METESKAVTSASPATKTAFSENLENTFGSPSLCLDTDMGKAAYSSFFPHLLFVSNGDF